MGFDFSGIYDGYSTSAKLVAETSRLFEEAKRADEETNRKRIEREEKMVAGAEAIITQNELLKENNLKLKEMLDTQVKANEEAKDELKKSKRFNLVMMIISVIAMLAAIAGPIVTVIVSKGIN